MPKVSPEDDRRFAKLDARLCVTEHLLVQIFSMYAISSPDPEGDVAKMHDQLRAGALLHPAPGARDPGRAALWSGELESAVDRFATAVRAQIALLRGHRRK
jgi:hypothetical protein